MTNEEKIRLEELRKKLQPKHIVTQDDNFKALIRFTVDAMSYHLVEMVDFVKIQLDKIDKFSGEELRLLTDISESLSTITEVFFNDDGKDFWEILPESEMFKYYLNEIQNGYHDGDCVGVAASCALCQAEQFYNLPSTSDWNKSDGYRMLTEFIELSNKERSLS